jgi:hypothetical protein
VTGETPVPVPGPGAAGTGVTGEDPDDGGL